MFLNAHRMPALQRALAFLGSGQSPASVQGPGETIFQNWIQHSAMCPLQDRPHRMHQQRSAWPPGVAATNTQEPQNTLVPAVSKMRREKGKDKQGRARRVDPVRAPQVSRLVSE